MIDKTLGSNGAHLLKTLAEREQTIFSMADAQEVLEGTYNATMKTLRRLTRAGWLVRLSAGKYAIVPLSSGDEAIPQINRYIIAHELIGDSSYYISHESAMDIHNMLTRPVTRVIITTTRRLNNREILGTPYLFVYAPSTAIWGFEPIWVTPHDRVLVSDLERTIIDGLNRSELCAGIGQIAEGLWMRRDDYDWEKFSYYVHRLGRRTVAQRLGYLLELYQLGTSILIDELQEMVGPNYASLDPLLPDEGTSLVRWRLRLNLETETLKDFVRT